MAKPLTQKAIPTLYNLSSSAARKPVRSAGNSRGWVPKLLYWDGLNYAQGARVLYAQKVTCGVKHNLVNIPRRNVADLRAIFPREKSSIAALEPSPREVSQTYQVKPDTVTESRLVLQYISDEYSNELANSTLLVKVDFALLFEVFPHLPPFPFGQLLGMGFRPMLWYFLGDQKDIYQLIEEALSEEKTWFAGKEIGLADFNMSFGMDMAVQRGYFDKTKFPKVGKWFGNVSARPAKTRALEKRGAYDLMKFK